MRIIYFKEVLKENGLLIIKEVFVGELSDSPMILKNDKRLLITNKMYN